MISPSEDGITHINVYSKGKTELGRWLTNFSYSPINIDDGYFSSIEGYWYWLTRKDDRLRKLVGYKAKSLGESLPIIDEPTDFEERIRKAITVKIETSQNKSMFYSSSLPFEHYYVYGDKVVDAGYKWILKHLEDLRKEMNK